MWCLIFEIFHYSVYKFIKITGNNCIKNKKRKTWHVLKSSVFKNFQWWSWRRKFYGKCIKLCFHVQRFPVNCFCVSLKIYWWINRMQKFHQNIFFNWNFFINTMIPFFFIQATDIRTSSVEISFPLLEWKLGVSLASLISLKMTIF